MGLSADNRLRRPADFRNVLRGGRRQGRNGGGRAGDRFLLLSAAPTNNTESRVGLAVSKKVGGAVTRNRVKRRLREICREVVVTGGDDPGQGWDVVITARVDAASASYADLRESVRGLITRVKTRR